MSVCVEEGKFKKFIETINRPNIRGHFHDYYNQEDGLISIALNPN